MPTLVGFFLTYQSADVTIVLYNSLRNTMFESLEIRKAANGFVMVINTEDESKEYIYDTERKLMRALKAQLGEKITDADKD